MKKSILILTAAFFIAFNVSAQIEKPVTWAYAAKKTGQNDATLYLKATIEEGWHIYSQNIKSGGPVKTSFAFTPSADYTKTGNTIEPKPITKFEQVFNMDVSYFENAVVFQQKVKLKKAATTIKGKVEFMVCNDSKCLPPDEVSFSIPVK